MTDSTIALPDGFFWGAATAAHQVEGGNVNSDWWQLEHAADTPCRESSGDAADSYHRYREDIGLLADAGLDTYRFSLEWSRIEPAPGEFSRAQLDHYRRMIEACAHAGVTPFLTLQHFTLPSWLAREGGWLAPGAVERFIRYVDACLPLLDDLDWVVTINEPNMVAMLDGVKTQVSLDAAGLPGPNPRVTDTLIEAHGQAVDRVRGVGRPRVGWTVANQVYQAADGRAAERDAYARPREDVFLEAAVADDFIGVQAYLRTVIGEHGPLPIGDDVERTLTGWEYYPAALGEAVRYTHEVTGGLPIVVTENGIATADDSRRIDYTLGALEGLAAAMADGADVRGYLHWSLLDNFEWMSGFAPTFGLIEVNRETFQRTPKPSLAWLGNWARQNRLPIRAAGTGRRTTR
jgi:beta-glucosidase